MPTNVYVDGFNLYHRLLKKSAYRWLDLMALVKAVLPNDQVGRIRYFTARVSALYANDRGPQHQDIYLRALRTIPNLTIHFGHFLKTTARMPLVATPSTKVEVVKVEEKGSDVNIASYMLLDGFRGEYTTAVVLSNDSDLTEPVRLVRHELKKTVGILCPGPAHPSVQLRREASFFKTVRPNILPNVLFPAQLSDAQGTITKPPGW